MTDEERLAQLEERVSDLEAALALLADASERRGIAAGHAAFIERLRKNERKA